MDSALLVFLDLGIVLVLAALVGIIARLLKQPFIPAYILLGVFLIPLLKIFHPGFLQGVNILDFMKPVEHIGIAFLLFIVGLELDFKKLKDVGSVATIGTIAQFAILFATGFIAASLFGWGTITAIYIGFLMAFSSTMVVLKLLSDKRELETLHGRIVIGILLMQDVLAVVGLMVLRNIGNFAPDSLLLSLLEGVLLIIGAWLLGKFVFPKLFSFAAKSQEFLLIISLAVCFAFSILFEWAGFSIAIGAFVAGVTLGNLPYSHEISGKIKSLKDFFLLLFFVSIGAQFAFGEVKSILLPFIILFAITIIIKPIVIMTITSIFGYKKRTSTLTSLSLGQVSEFSLIIVAQGIALSHIRNDIYSLVILLTLATIATTSYFVKFDDFIYSKLSGVAKIFEKLSIHKKELIFLKSEPSHDIVVIGADRMGYSIITSLKKQKKDFLVVDFNPDMIKRLIKQEVHCIYGDVGDEEIREHLNLKSVKMVISTIPDMHENILLLKSVKEKNPEAVVILTADFTDDALQLYEQGADYVIVPHYLGGEHLSILLEEQALDIDKLVNTKIAHIKDLKNRRHLHKKRN